MPDVFFGPFSAKDDNFAPVIASNANLGRVPLGSMLILPDGREFRFTLNDGTVEIAGDMYQSVAEVGDHENRAMDVVRAIGATALSAALTTTAAAIDIYAEGMVHVNDQTGVGFGFRIKRAFNSGDAHAAAVASGVLTVNLEPDESLQVATDTSSQITFTRNRYHQVGLTGAPPTASLSGVSPGVAAANRFYYSQTRGYAACLVDGTLLAGLPVQASVGTAGSVENKKTRVRTGGTVTIVGVTAGRYAITDQDGAIVTGVLSNLTTSGTNVDISGGIAANAPTVGQCIRTNATGEHGLIDLEIT